MSKRNKIIIIVGIIILLVIVGLYGTFAINTNVEQDNDWYVLTLSDAINEITIPANSNKTIIYKLKNLNDGDVSYGVGYSGTNINVKVYSNSFDEVTGIVSDHGYKYIKLRIENTGSTESVATIVSVLGYENGGQLIEPQGITLVTQTYTPPTTELTGIKATYLLDNIFNDNGKTVPESGDNSVLLKVDKDNQIIEDSRGNLRYYGTGIDSEHTTDADYSEPNNYIYFNCSNYSNQSSNTCEKWRIIGKVDGKLKLIRGSTIGSYSWDTNTSSGINQWGNTGTYEGADLMHLLNPDYENYTLNNSLYWNSSSGRCYNNSANSNTSCNFTSTGLKNDITRNMIAMTTYYTRGTPDTMTSTSLSLYPYNMLEYERATSGGLKITSASSDVVRTGTWVGRIAIPYVSDFGYATDFNLCDQTLGDYSNNVNNRACLYNNWMWRLLPDVTTISSSLSFWNGSLWFLDSFRYKQSSSTTEYDYYVVGKTLAAISGYQCYSAKDILPVLSLDSKVRIDTNHIGNSDDPYTLIVTS